MMLLLILALAQGSEPAPFLQPAPAATPAPDSIPERLAEAKGLLVDLLRERGQTAQTLEAAEAARGRAFSDLLAARQVALRPGEAAALTAIREGEARLRAQDNARPADEAVVAELARTRGATEAGLTGKLRTLRGEQPELASLVAVEPLTGSEIAETTKRLDATVVEYLVTEKRLFMDGFYAGLRSGHGKAHALRNAQLRTLRRYPHPALWSAFLLVGEAR